MNRKWQLVLASMLLTASIFSVVSCSGKPTLKDGDTVTVDYTLKLEDGTVYDTSIGKEPFQFTLGENAVIPGFEAAVKSMKVGETKTVTIPPEEGYGQPSDTLIQVVDRAQLPSDFVPQVGGHIQGQSSDGAVRDFLIIEVNDTTITVDGNSPLAGKTLTFEITLIEIVPK